MENKMIERVKMLKAMEFIVRQINDEEVFMRWLYAGVADGDIPYGDFRAEWEDEDMYDYYISDEEFSDLMRLFLRLMKQAYNSGGLFCGDVVSR